MSSEAKPVTIKAKIERICTNPGLINSVAIQDERDDKNKQKSLEKIIKFDHQKAHFGLRSLMANT